MSEPTPDDADLTPPPPAAEAAADSPAPPPEPEAEEPARRGAPPKYRDDFCERVVELGREGKSFAQIAAELGVSRRTIELWRHKFPDFDDALELARDFCLAWWETKAQDNLTTSSWQGGTWSRSMAARFPDDYREVSRREHTGVADAPPIKTESTQTVQLAAGEAYLAMLNGPADPPPPPAPAPTEAPAA